MKTKAFFLIGFMVSLAIITYQKAFSQDSAPVQSVQTEEAKTEAVQVGGAVPSDANKQETETQWVWGEVVTVDLQNKTVFVKYLDYESDQEKEISIVADDATVFENVASVDELKPKDTVSIDYLSMEGKNLAKNISVEKPEAVASPDVASTDTETKPQDLTPKAETTVQEPESTPPTGN